MIRFRSRGLVRELGIETLEPGLILISEAYNERYPKGMAVSLTDDISDNTITLIRRVDVDMVSLVKRLINDYDVVLLDGEGIKLSLLELDHIATASISLGGIVIYKKAMSDNCQFEEYDIAHTVISMRPQVIKRHIGVSKPRSTRNGTGGNMTEHTSGTSTVSEIYVSHKPRGVGVFSHCTPEEELILSGGYDPDDPFKPRSECSV